MATFTVSTFTNVPSNLNASDWLVVSRFGTIAANLPVIGSVNGAGSNAIQVDGTISNTAAPDGAGIRLNAGSDTVVIGATGILRSHDTGLFINGGNNTISVAGVIQTLSDATAFGIHLIGTSNNNITIQAGGLISAGFGLLALGGGNTFKNFGTVTATNSSGVELNGGGNSVTNAGLIDAVSIGMVVGAGAAANSVVNSGTIRGSLNDGMRADGVTALFNTGTIESVFESGYYSLAGTNTVINNGAIIARAQTIGMDVGSGVDTIVNNGLIFGNGGAVSLGGGNDLFDGRLGLQVGLVSGGTGNDTIYGGAQSDMLAGNSDNDTLYGMGGVDALAGGDGVDTLYGGDGADNLMGEAGTDLIYGGAGGDIIRGGTGGDLIVFNVGDNGDLIQNFNEGGTRDGFDLRGYFNATGYTGTTPRAAGIMQVLQNGADTDVYLHGSFAFRIQGVAAAAIDDSYFLFQ